MKRHPIAVVFFYLERGSKGIFCGKKLFKKAHSTELRPMDVDVIRSFQWLNACHWSSTTCGQAIRRAAGAAYHSLKKNTWSDLEIGVDCTDTFSTWHFPPNGEPQKLDGVFSNSTIKDICFGKNWMTFFRKKTHGTSLVDPWVRPAMAAMLELPAEARRAWASMPCGDVMC